MYLILPSDHIYSMDNCYLAMCSGKKKISYLLNELHASSASWGRYLSQYISLFHSRALYS